MAAPHWSVFAEAALVTSHAGDSGTAAFVGGGIKLLLSTDLQVDVSLDRGLTEEAADWLMGLGVVGRF